MANIEDNSDDNSNKVVKEEKGNMTTTLGGILNKARDQVANLRGSTDSSMAPVVESLYCGLKICHSMLNKMNQNGGKMMSSSFDHANAAKYASFDSLHPQERDRKRKKSLPGDSQKPKKSKSDQDSDSMKNPKPDSVSDDGDGGNTMEKAKGITAVDGSNEDAKIASDDKGNNGAVISNPNSPMQSKEMHEELWKKIDAKWKAKFNKRHGFNHALEKVRNQKNNPDGVLPEEIRMFLYKTYHMDLKFVKGTSTKRDDLWSGMVASKTLDDEALLVGQTVIDRFI